MVRSLSNAEVWALEGLEYGAFLGALAACLGMSLPAPSDLLKLIPFVGLYAVIAPLGEFALERVLARREKRPAQTFVALARAAAALGPFPQGRVLVLKILARIVFDALLVAGIARFILHKSPHLLSWGLPLLATYAVLRLVTRRERVSDRLVPSRSAV